MARSRDIVFGADLVEEVVWQKVLPAVDSLENRLALHLEQRGLAEQLDLCERQITVRMLAVEQASNSAMDH